MTRRLVFAVRAVREMSRGCIGDAVAYKTVALGPRPYPEIAIRLATLTELLPEIEVTELATLPPGSFGRCLSEFIHSNGLQSLTVSAALRGEIRAEEALGVRYTLLHDAFHVLLNFDATLAGELGVWSFVAAQGYSAHYRFAARMATLVYPLLAGSRDGMEAHRRAGDACGRRAKCVIAHPLELEWGKQLHTLRVELGIHAKGAFG